MSSRRTASASRSSWVKTTTWRSTATSASTRARPSTLAGSMDCTGSSMTTNRNGLCSTVARGRNRDRASACSSPWLMTPSAAPPSVPSTRTSSATCRWLPVPSSWTGPRSTLLCWRRVCQIALGRVGEGGEAFVAQRVRRVGQPLQGPGEPVQRRLRRGRRGGGVVPGAEPPGERGPHLVAVGELGAGAGAGVLDGGGQRPERGVEGVRRVPPRPPSGPPPASPTTPARGRRRRSGPSRRRTGGRYEVSARPAATAAVSSRLASRRAAAVSSSSAARRTASARQASSRVPVRQTGHGAVPCPSWWSRATRSNPAIRSADRVSAVASSPARSAARRSRAVAARTFSASGASSAAERGQRGAAGRVRVGTGDELGDRGEVGPASTRAARRPARPAGRRRRRGRPAAPCARRTPLWRRRSASCGRAGGFPWRRSADRARAGCASRRAARWACRRSAHPARCRTGTGGR